MIPFFVLGRFTTRQIDCRRFQVMRDGRFQTNRSDPRPVSVLLKKAYEDIISILQRMAAVCTIIVYILFARFHSRRLGHCNMSYISVQGRSVLK